MPGRQTKTPKRTTRQSNVVPGSPIDIGILKPLSPKTPGWMSGRNAVFKTPESPSQKRLRTRRSSMYQSKMNEKCFESQSKTTKFELHEKQHIRSPPVAKRTRRSSIYQKTTMKLVDIPLSPESKTSVTTRTRRASVYHKGGGAKLVQITEETGVTQKGRKMPVSVKPFSSLKTQDKSGSSSTATNKQDEAKPPRPATKSLAQKRKVQTPVKSPKAKRAKVSSPSLQVKTATQETEKVTSPQGDRKATLKTAMKSSTKKTPVKSLTAKTPAKSTRSSRSTPLMKDEVSSVTKSPAKQSSAKTPAAKTPVVQSKAKTPATKTPVVQSKAKTPATKTPVVQSKAKTTATKTPVVQSKAKTPATKTPVVQSKAKTPAAKTPVQNKTKTPAAKSPIVQNKTNTPAAKTPVVQSKTKTPAAKSPIVQKKTKTPAAKTVVQNKMKTPAAKTPVVMDKMKTPAAMPSKIVSSPLKDTPVLKSHKQSVLIQNNHMASVKKRKLSAENGDVNSPKPHKKHKSVESVHELKNVKYKSVVVQSPPGSGKRLKTPKKLPKTPVVKRKTTPSRRAEVSSQKVDIIPVHVDQENEPLNITLNDEANTSITSQTSNELNTTYSHSSRCIIL
ncbi:neurofilament heavy polypeptide-like [Pecten maximus]|uniref:neurofilament heavy polypeptide-like n=1 Tax=Pecten maximus TaxID=6579 RepID=UPI001457ECCA|nr:neurofilament heavy polypeptide-like [Pecten maximus]